MSHSLAYCPTVKSLKRAGFTTRTMPRHTYTIKTPLLAYCLPTAQQ